MKLTLLALGADLCLATSTARAADSPAGAWLDTYPTAWNNAGMAVPSAPYIPPPTDPQATAYLAGCEQPAPPPRSYEEALVAQAGWRLETTTRISDHVDVLDANEGYGGGMCRPSYVQQFVFYDGNFVGTAMPKPGCARCDGNGGITNVTPDGTLIGSYTRYSSSDALCCPSGTSSLVFRIDQTDAGLVLDPIQGSEHTTWRQPY
jgi:LppP/LprE lipoprotein